MTTEVTRRGAGLEGGDRPDVTQKRNLILLVKREFGKLVERSAVFGVYRLNPFPQLIFLPKWGTVSQRVCVTV